ncbi:MAG TPA: carbohydrate porin [Phycisphaerae bacterium]|nr:carbohydrate porin [Phycisphaerae bacterium]
MQPTSAPAATAERGQGKPLRLPYSLWTTDRLTGDWGGARTKLEDAGLTFRLFYNQQAQQNFLGGLQHDHGRFTGSYDLQFEADFQKLGLVPGSSFFMETSGSYGDGINPTKVGALFNVNADASGDQSIYVKKWWFTQRLLKDKVEFRLGEIQTNKDLFDVSFYANHEDLHFLNQASIRNPTIPHRTGIGAFAKVEPVDWFYFQAAAVDAQSIPRTTGFNTAFHDEAHFLGFWEAGLMPTWQSGRGSLPGKYRIGWWYNPTPKMVFEDTLDGRRQPDEEAGDLGLYLGLDQMVWKENSDPMDKQGLGIFARYGTSHGDVNKVNNAWEVGASYKGLIPRRDQDVMGLAVSQGILSEKYRNECNEQADRETVYEWYYAIRLTPWCIFTPDLQVVTNPGGNRDAPDAFIGGFRIRIIF